MKIAMLGAGNSAQCLAGDCALGGAEVAMFEYEEYSGGVKELFENKKIEIYGPELNSRNFKRNGVGTLSMVSTDLAEVVKDAKHILISVRSIGFERLFNDLIPLFEDGQIVSIFPDNFGSMLLRKMMNDAGCDKRVIIAGWSSLPYGSRVTDVTDGVSRVHMMYRAVELRFDTMPQCDYKEYLESVKDIPPLDSCTPDHGDTMIDVGLSNVNPILHVPSTLLNAGVIENWGRVPNVGDNDIFFNIYLHGMSPSIAKIQYKIFQEEKAIADALGVGIAPYSEENFYKRFGVLAPEFMGEEDVVYSDVNDEDSAFVCQPLVSDVAQKEDYCVHEKPGARFDLETRYVTEDVPVGCGLYYRLAQMAGVETPAIYNMIQLASLMKEEDYFQGGFTLEELGIAGMNKEELNKFLREY